MLEIGTYIADDWRVTSRLTINIGLRYEFLPPPVEVSKRMMKLDKHTGKVMSANFTPTGTLEFRRNGNVLRRVLALPTHSCVALC